MIERVDSPSLTGRTNPTSLIPCRTAAESIAHGRECFVYNAECDQVNALNQTATEIWELCDGRRTLDELAACLGARYGVNAALLLDDVIVLVNALHGRGLVRLAAGPAKG